VDNFCLKVCCAEFKEAAKLMDCQHPYVVQVYAMVLTDKGNMAILLELAQSDFVSFYDDVIQ